MSAPLTPKRLAEITAMRFVTGLNAACGHFDTPVERELYDLAAVNYNARLELLAEVERMTARVAELEAAPSRAEILREAADELVAFCPNHGNRDTSFIDCHCPAADDLRRTANGGA